MTFFANLLSGCAKREAALALLIQEQRPITFKAVAQPAGISTAWLYDHEAIKARIIHLRT